MAGGLTLSHIHVPAGTRAYGIEFEHSVFTVRLPRAWGCPHPVQLKISDLPEISGLFGALDPGNRKFSKMSGKRRLEGVNRVFMSRRTSLCVFRLRMSACTYTQSPQVLTVCLEYSSPLTACPLSPYLLLRRVCCCNLSDNSKGNLMDG